MKRKIILLLLYVFYLSACNDKPEVVPASDGTSVYVYPNPFIDFVRIDVPFQSTQTSTVHVFDPKGNVILEEDVTQSKHNFSLDLQGEKAGTYHAVVQTGEAKKIIKLIKL